MGHRLHFFAQKLLPYIHVFWISQGGFLSFDGKAPRASSTQHLRFPGAKGTRLHSSNTVADEFTGSYLTHSTMYRSSICSVLREKIYPSRIANMNELKKRLIDKWELFDQSIVNAAIAL